MNTYKICLILNRYTGKIDIKKYAIDWLKTYANLDVVVDTILTDFDVTTQKIGNATYSGVIVGADILPKVREVIPEHKYNSVVFIYGNSLDGIRLSSVNIMGDTPLYADTEFVQVCKVNDYGKTINHELFHAFFMKAHKLQANIVDNMDTYLKDSDLSVNNVIDTNREIALQSLKPYWSQICAFRSLSNPIVNPLSTWKYFKLTEKTGSLGHTIADLKPELVDLMNKMRGECGFAWIITSGYRTVSENNKLPGAASDSAHTNREAVDIYCIDDRKRQILLDVVRANGINRVGLGKTFIHIDISKTLPNNVTWNY